MDSFLFSYVMFYVCAVAHGVEKSFVYEFYSENEINGNVISSFDTSSVQACVVRCDDTYGCLSINFHKENEKCVLTDYYPTDESKSGVPESGWKIFFRRHFAVPILSPKFYKIFTKYEANSKRISEIRPDRKMVLDIETTSFPSFCPQIYRFKDLEDDMNKAIIYVDLLKGATAWQSSTFVKDGTPLSADKALDGQIDQNIVTSWSCAHTNKGFSYWAVEFGTPGPVKEVIIYLRNDGFLWVNTKFTVTVSNSRDDVINDGGMLCGKYFGPGIDKAPFRLTITCANTIYGKFLKIKHGIDVAIALCEVFVYTPH